MLETFPKITTKRIFSVCLTMILKSISYIFNTWKFLSHKYEKC